MGYAKMKLKLITMMIFKQLECIQQYFSIEDWKKSEKDNYNSIEKKMLHAYHLLVKYWMIIKTAESLT